tara:strand:+ start:96 stop:662 length:567 start_codon:yes stop_codon:yes gene_type:complete
MSKRQCAHCKTRKPAEQMLIRGLKAYCSQDHFIEWAAGNVSPLAKKGRTIERKRHQARKEKVKTKGQHLRDAQSEFNKYIRLRDAKEPCISCGRFHTGQYHAGHYLTVGAKPELRFEEDNCHKQCAPCNNHLSGNLVLYRVNLINKIGLERVEWLEGPHELPNWTIEQIQEIKKHYRRKWQELEKKAA